MCANAVIWCRRLWCALYEMWHKAKSLAMIFEIRNSIHVLSIHLVYSRFDRINIAVVIDAISVFRPFLFNVRRRFESNISWKALENRVTNRHTQEEKKRRLKRDQPLTIGTRQQLIHFKYMRLKKLQLPFNLPKGPHKRNRSQFFLFHNQVSIDSLFCCVSIFSNNGEWSLRKRSHTHTHNDNTCTY